MTADDQRRIDGSGYDPRTNTFHARFDWEDPSSLITVLMKTLSVAADVPPLELETLQQHIDTDALTALFKPISADEPRDDGSVRFDFNGHEVTVHATGEIVIAGPEPPVSETNNVLLLAPAFTASDTEACFEHLQGGGPREGNVLSIAFERPPERQLEVWREHVGPLPAETAIIEMGATTRSATPHSAASELGLTITAIGDESDIATLGVRITEQLSEWRDDGNPVLVCFHSIHALLQHVDTKRAFKFLDILTRQVKKDDVMAHYHLDPSRLDRESVLTLEVLFDETIDRSKEREPSSLE